MMVTPRGGKKKSKHKGKTGKKGKNKGKSYKGKGTGSNTWLCGQCHWGNECPNRNGNNVNQVNESQSAVPPSNQSGETTSVGGCVDAQGEPVLLLQHPRLLRQDLAM